MICKNCNAQLEDGSTFCLYCGAKCAGDATAIQQNVTYPSANMGENPSDVTQVQPNDYQANHNYSANGANQNYVPNQPAVQTVYAQSSAVATAEAPVALAEVDMEGEAIPPKKKGKKKLLITGGIIAGVLAILAFVYFVFGNMIFFAVAPEEYVANLFGNTLDKVYDETADVGENVFGFEVAGDNEFQVSANIDYKDAYDDVNVVANVANLPDDNKMIYNADVDTDDVSFKSEGYIDDENIAVMLPGSNDKYLSVPSKEFGDKYSSSKGYIAKELEDEEPKLHGVLEELDLSYSTLKELVDRDSDLSEAMSEHLTDSILKMLEKSQIGDRKSVDYKFKDETVSANEIKIELETDDLYDMMISAYDSMKNDDEITSKIGKEILKLQANEYKDRKKDSENKDIELVIIEYDDRIVCATIFFEFDEDPDDYYDEYEEKSKITIACTNPDYVLNGITVTEETDFVHKYEDDDYSSYEKGTRTEEIVFESNWCNEDEVINASVVNNYDYKDEDEDGDTWKSKRTTEFAFVLDYNKSKWDLDVNSDSYYKYYDGEEENESDKKSFSGKCSKKDGFVFEIDENWDDVSYENSMEYDEWKATEYEFWLKEIYSTYRNEYLYYVYENVGNFYYDFDTFSDWFRSYGGIWDVPDYDFENWLYDESDSDYYSDYDAYEEDTRVEKKVDAHFKMTLKVGENVGFNVKNAKCDNILDWKEKDFEKFGDKFRKKVEK